MLGPALMFPKKPEKGAGELQSDMGANFPSCRREFWEWTGRCPSSGQPPLGVTHIGYTQSGLKQPGREEVGYLG